MSNTKEWTEADTITLDRLIKQDCSNKMIAKILGRSESYISQKKKKFGFPITKPKRWTDEEIDQLRRLYFKGFSDEEIAEKLNRSVDTIRVHRTENGINELKDLDWDKKFIQDYFINQLLSCKSIDEAVSKTGVKDYIIKKRINEYFKKNILSKEVFNKVSTIINRRIVKLENS